jgi:dTDP-4-amino-4,6-dideoxygalactose transaminase
MFGKEEKEAVLRVLESGTLSGFQGNWSYAFYGGQEVRELEKEWADYFGVKHAITCNSATSGLFLACAAIGLSPVYENIEKQCNEHWNTGYVEGYNPPEVIVTPYSMTCSASIPLHFGAKPVFADIESDYYCLDPDSVEKAITERTKAIIVVDLFGQPYDAEKINAIAKKHNLFVIEDAAQAIGARYKGKYAGTLGDIGVFSLNRHKHIQCGEGGVMVTDNDELAFKIRLAMNHSEAVINDMIFKSENDCRHYGIIPKINDGNLTVPPLDSMQLVGMNLRMTEIQACIAREQLKKLSGILQTVRENAKYFPVKVRPECESSFYRYAFSKSYPLCTNKILNNEGMEKFNFKQHYITPLFKLPLFQSLGYDQEQCPVCQEVEENICLAWLKGMG